MDNFIQDKKFRFIYQNKIYIKFFSDNLERTKKQTTFWKWLGLFCFVSVCKIILVKIGLQMNSANFFKDQRWTLNLFSIIDKFHFILNITVKKTQTNKAYSGIHKTVE